MGVSYVESNVELLLALRSRRMDVRDCSSVSVNDVPALRGMLRDRFGVPKKSIAGSVKPSVRK